MVDPKRVAQGKKNRTSGKQFEVRVRKDLEEKDWIVDRWTNNIEFYYPLGEIELKKQIGKTFNGPREVGRIIPAKAKWNNFTKSMIMGSGGFPDFIAFKQTIQRFEKKEGCHLWMYRVIGVECKINGTLTALEKQKCRWYLDNNIFSKIFIAEKTKVKNKIVIVYHDFKEKYGK